jgi:glyoxylase-like metal-dependent hydrolase (beta-lactamase superfamily II)
MRIHHLNCGTLCPRGAKLINGEGGLLAPGKSVCHCLLIEAESGLVLLDTGFGTEDVRNPSQLGPIFKMMRPRTEMGETAVKQVEALGFAAEDVHQIVTTHLDPDHSGGLPDFPQAEVHVFGRELDAALDPVFKDRPRYLGAHWKHNPNWVRHEAEGDEWFGFEGVRILPDLGAEVLLVPLIGHSRGHTGVAIKVGDRWLLHCGDAYFHHDEIATPPSCPPGLRFFQLLNAADGKQRRANQERLRELVTKHGDEVDLFCSHDPFELERAQTQAGATAAAE